MASILLFLLFASMFVYTLFIFFLFFFILDIMHRFSIMEDDTISFPLKFSTPSLQRFIHHTFKLFSAQTSITTSQLFADKPCDTIAFPF